MTEDAEEAAASQRPPTTFTNVADLVARHAATRPDAVAVVQPGPARRALSWAELDAQVDAVGSGLAAYGLVAGRRVAICGANSIEFVVAYLAVLRAGFVAVPLNPQYTLHELSRRLADCGARVLLWDRGPAADVPDGPGGGSSGSGAADLAGVELLPLSPTGLAALASSGRAPIGSPRDREALAVLLYTAGTSGQPQAAMLTHRALLAHLEHIDAVGILGAETHVLAMLPLFHVFGLNAVLGSWAFAGGRLIVMDGLTEDFFDVVRAEQVTNLPLAPAIVARLCQDDRLAEGLSGVRTVVSGAAPLPHELAADFTRRTGLRIEQGYGLTEAAPGVSATFGGQLRAPGHVGRPLPGVEIRIADGSDPSEPGVIWIRGDNLFSGYWPDGRDRPGPDGWFSTEDIGYLDAGELYLVDRARELVIVNGFNVYPAEVEQVIAEVPGVAEVAVIGQPDPRTGEQVVAFVVGTASADEVRQRCATQLAKFKRPAQVLVVPELPRGATGKVLKGALRHILGVDEVSAS